MSPTKRSRFDPFADNTHPRWLVLRDMFQHVVDSTELPAGTDLRRAFADGIADLQRAGWESEGASGAMVFVRRGNERRMLVVSQTDPDAPPAPGHAFLAGRCPTCE
jgi:hypothetical protein